MDHHQDILYWTLYRGGLALPNSALVQSTKYSTREHYLMSGNNINAHAAPIEKVLIVRSRLAWGLAETGLQRQGSCRTLLVLLQR